MLAEFRVKNYRSFKDEQLLSMIASCEESQGPNSVEIGKYQILKTAAIYGANASGKSNLIKALACMKEIVAESASYKPEQKLPVEPFHFDDLTRVEPTSFEANFYIEGIRYQYGFTATSEKIHDEYLLAWPLGRSQTWFQRECDKETGETKKYFGPNLKGKNETIWSMVKENTLFLSTAAQLNHEKLSKIYKWFASQLRELPGYTIARYLTSSALYDDKTESKRIIYNAVVNALKKADLGIVGLDIEKASIDQLKLPESLPTEVKEQIREEFKTNPPYNILAYHQFGKSGKRYPLPFEEESEGTKKFFSYLGPLLVSVAYGYTLFKDELESSLHPKLTREMINEIKYGNDGSAQAQLIFTTHDTTLLDPELFGRDQIWFMEKDKSGATKLYSLADYKDVRKDEAYAKRYLSGRYGAVPILERLDLGGKKN